MIYSNLKSVSLKLIMVEWFKDEKDESEKFQFNENGQGMKV